MDSKALVLMRGFNLWRDFNMLEGQISKAQAARRPLVCINAKFVTQMIKELTRGSSPAVLHVYRRVRCKGQGQPFLQ